MRKKRIPPLLDSSFRLILGGLLCFLLLEYTSPSWQQDLASTTFSIPRALLALAVVALASAVMALRWKVVAGAIHGSNYRFSTTFRSFVLARFLGFFVSPVAMDLIGRRLGMKLQSQTSSTTSILVQIVIERWFDVLLPAVLIASFAFFDVPAGDSILWHASLACIIGTTVGLLTLRPIILTLQRLQFRFLRTTISSPPPQVTWSTLGAIAALGALRWMTIIWHTDTIAAAFGLHLNAEALTLGTATSQLAGVIAITPGGLGIQEAGWLIGLKNAATSTQEGSLIAIVQRIGAAVCFAILAGTVWFFSPSRLRKND